RLLLRAPFGLNFLENIEYLIVEMGIDEPTPPKNMEYLLTIIQPDIAVLLNVSAVHSMQFRSVKLIAHEKSKLATLNPRARVVIYNADDKYISKEVRGLKGKKLMSFGKNKKNYISYDNYKVSTKQTSFSFSTNKEFIALNIKNYALPEEHRELLAASILVGQEAGLSLSQIQRSLEKNIEIPAGRASIFTGIKNSIIIDSSYNASRSSTLALLELTHQLSQKYKRPVAFVFGDMRELGEFARREHEVVARKIADVVNYLYCVGPLTKKYVVPKVKTFNLNPRGLSRSIHILKWFSSSIDAGKHLKKHVPHKSIILFKGSQNTIYLEEAIKPVLKNKQDAARLCRQNKYWTRLKKVFFKVR
ncbi:MAG: Mur ligase family protein, partial [Candidatus Paceibacterota bacterium]